MPLNLRDIADRRGEVTFSYLGESVTVLFRADRLTREFRAEAMRLNRDVLKMQRRQDILMAQATRVQAADGTVEAQTEDEEAERAILELIGQGDALKREIDRLIATIVIDWDLLLDDGRPVPLTADALFPVPAMFEGAVLTAILGEGNMGEAPGARQSTSLPLPLRQKDRQATSRLSQNGTATSRRAGSSQP